MNALLTVLGSALLVFAIAAGCKRVERDREPRVIVIVLAPAECTPLVAEVVHRWGR